MTLLESPAALGSEFTALLPISVTSGLSRGPDRNGHLGGTRVPMPPVAAGKVSLALGQIPLHARRTIQSISGSVNPHGLARIPTAIRLSSSARSQAGLASSFRRA